MAIWVLDCFTNMILEVSINGGTPSHHPFQSDFPLETVQFGGTPPYETPHIGQYNSLKSPTRAKDRRDDPPHVSVAKDLLLLGGRLFESSSKVSQYGYTQ